MFYDFKLSQEGISMKKGLMISIAPLAGLPILSIVACSNNATTPNQQVATNDQQISFQDQSNFAFGNPRGFANDASFDAVSYTHLTLPTNTVTCRSRWSPYH